ncbi:MAG: hypothetical protein K8R74_01960 [Bacteroidales bacterium]|nr:hypothetical protein [Bacteroidales bacterium]
MAFKNLTYTILLSTLVLLFVGCQHNTIEEYTDKEGNKVIREWYNKTQIKSIKTFTNPEQTNYRYMVFYKDGLLMDSSTFVDSKISGLRKYYEISTGLLHLENYKNGVMNGPQKAIFSSGISSFEGYRKDNNKVGEWKFFYPSGKLITYEYYDSTGQLKYFKKYDKNGSILKTDGTGLIEVIAYQTTINLREPVTGYAVIAMPVGCSLRLTISDMTPGVNTQPFFEKQLIKSLITWEKYFVTPGEKQLLFTLIITDERTGEEEQSSFEQLIKVESN